MLASDIRMPTILLGQLALLRHAGIRSGHADVRLGSRSFRTRPVDRKSLDGLPADDRRHGVGGRRLWLDPGDALPFARAAQRLRHHCRAHHVGPGRQYGPALRDAELSGHHVEIHVQRLGLDGYLKVFWYDDPTQTLWQSAQRLLPELAVLLVTTLVFLAVARCWRGAGKSFDSQCRTDVGIRFRKMDLYLECSGGRGAIGRARQIGRASGNREGEAPAEPKAALRDGWPAHTSAARSAAPH